MNNLPEGWVSVKLQDLIDLNPKTEAPDDTDSAFSPMAMLGTRYRDLPRFEVRKWGEIRSSYVHFKDGDVLLAKITPCFENGKAGIAHGLPNGIGAGSSEYFVCRPRSQALDPRYLLALFKTQDFLKSGETRMTGSVGHKRVPKDVLLGTEIPLAPAAEQSRIADKLDALLARVDACRERLDRVPAIIKRFRQAVISATTSQSGTGADSSSDRHDDVWPTVRLTDVLVEMRNGLATKPAETPPGVKILRISSVRPMAVDLEDHRFLKLDASDIETYRLRENDLLFTRYNGTFDFVGACARIPMIRGDVVYPDKLIRVRIDENIVSPAYLELIFTAPSVRRQVEGYIKSSAGQKGISGADLKTIEFALPPPRVQAEIVRRTDALFALADSIEASCQTAREQVDLLTPSILTKAFRGELVPHDQNDEPARALLERLRTTIPSDQRTHRRKPFRAEAA